MSSVKNIFEEIIKTDHKVITEESSKGILKKYSVKVPGFALAKSADEAVKQAKKTRISTCNESCITTNPSQN